MLAGNDLTFHIPVYSNRGEIHRCYPHIQQLIKCANSSLFPDLECVERREAYLECYRGTRSSQAFEQIYEDMRSGRILHVPTYDMRTDKWNYPEGQAVPKLTDFRPNFDESPAH